MMWSSSHQIASTFSFLKGDCVYHHKPDCPRRIDSRRRSIGFRTIGEYDNEEAGTARKLLLKEALTREYQAIEDLQEHDDSDDAACRWL